MAYFWCPEILKYNNSISSLNNRIKAIGQIDSNTEYNITLPINTLCLFIFGHPFINNSGLYIIATWNTNNSGRITPIMEASLSSISIEKNILTFTSNTSVFAGFIALNEII